MGNYKRILIKTKRFIFDDDSIWSWIVDIVLAFMLIKFIVYPFLGFILSTTHPIVAVVSGSMEHDGSYDDWWALHQEFYLKEGITREDFLKFRFRNGFNTGDIMILKGKAAPDIGVGEVIVYWSGNGDPIIHRVVKKWHKDNHYYFQTKGDHNSGSNFNEVELREDIIVGYNKYNKGSVAVMRIPYLGWIKIGFVNILQIIGVL